MESTTILLILLAFLLGALLSVFILNKNGKNKDDTISQELAAKEIQISDIKEKAIKNEAALRERYDKLLEEADSKSKQKHLELKAKYEALLAEATSKCEQLDELLKSTTDGKLDEQIRTRLSEADSLKKKLKELEEDLEDKEDDIDDLKKKIKNKDVEMGELQTSLHKEKKASQELRMNLSTMQEELDQKREELRLKLESLDFIHHILEAKDIQAADIVQLEKNIDFFESFLKGRYIDLHTYMHENHTEVMMNQTELRMTDKKQILDSFELWASTKRKSWLDGKTTIAFVGEFSAGKTSIVNRILSQDNPSIPLLPVSTKATTAIPTYISHGPRSNYLFVSGDKKQKTIKEEVFKKISKEVLDQIKGVSSLIKYFVMTCPNPHLENISILDTPGFISNDKKDQDRTIEVINECDALFWVIDVNSGTINRSSISVIKEKLRKPLYIVINKVDTKAKSEIQNVENLVRKTMEKEGIPIKKYIRFSSKAPLEEINNTIMSIPKTELRTTFVNEIGNDLQILWNSIDQKEKRLTSNLKSANEEKKRITDQVKTCMDQLRKDCNTARNIPHWEEHLLRSDCYEMSALEGKQLLALLGKIADSHTPYLDERFDDQQEKVKEVQKRYEELQKTVVAYNKIMECAKHFNKMIHLI